MGTHRTSQTSSLKSNPVIVQLDHQVQEHGSSLIEIRSAIKSIAESLHKLTELETHHVHTRESLARAFTEIGKVEERQNEMDKTLPTLKLASRAVFTGIGLVVLTVIGVSLKLMLTP